MENEVAECFKKLQSGLVTMCEKKLRNLEKRKNKLNGYKASRAKGETLEKDKLQALSKLDSVVGGIEMCQELSENMSAFMKECEAEIKSLCKKCKVQQQTAPVATVNKAPPPQITPQPKDVAEKETNTISQNNIDMDSVIGLEFLAFKDRVSRLMMCCGDDSVRSKIDVDMLDHFDEVCCLFLPFLDEAGISEKFLQAGLKSSQIDAGLKDSYGLWLKLYKGSRETIADTSVIFEQLKKDIEFLLKEPLYRDWVSRQQPQKQPPTVVSTAAMSQQRPVNVTSTIPNSTKKQLESTFQSSCTLKFFGHEEKPLIANNNNVEQNVTATNINLPTMPQSLVAPPSQFQGGAAEVVNVPEIIANQQPPPAKWMTTEPSNNNKQPNKGKIVDVVPAAAAPPPPPSSWASICRSNDVGDVFSQADQWRNPPACNENAMVVGTWGEEQGKNGSSSVANNNHQNNNTNQNYQRRGPSNRGGGGGSYYRGGGGGAPGGMNRGGYHRGGGGGRYGMAPRAH